MAKQPVDGSKLRAAFSKIAAEDDSNPAPSKAVEKLADLLAGLRALYFHYQHAHWQSQGPNYYGDHLLFQRLYESVSDQIDGLAEKIIGYYGNDAIEFMDQAKLVAEKAKKQSGDDFVSATLAAEEALCKQISDIFDSMEDADKLPLGLNDFLAALDNDRSTAIYLLKQRKAG